MEFLNGVKGNSCRAILTPPKEGKKHVSPRNSSLLNRKEETKQMPLAKDMDPVRHSEDKKNMGMSNGMKNMVDQIVSSYETRIESIGTLFDTTHQILQGFQDSLLDTREEREKLNRELRENLAKNKSLRRKDFDNLMEGIILTQNERKREVRDLLNSYLHEQKEMAQGLKENLGKFKDSLAKGEAQRIKEFQEMIRGILVKQEERKEEVTLRLEEFKKEQIMLTSRLKELLAKGKELRIRDFKSMLKEFNARYQERLALQEGRGKEVRHILGEFQKRRKETAPDWRTMQIQLPHRGTTPSAG
jgi:hypothetical protein